MRRHSIKSSGVRVEAFYFGRASVVIGLWPAWKWTVLRWGEGCGITLDIGRLSLTAGILPAEDELEDYPEDEIL